MVERERELEKRGQAAVVSQICVDCILGLDSAGMSRPSLEGVDYS